MKIDNSDIRISLVIPAFNEEDSLKIFLNSLKKELSKIKTTYEIIVVNDGSTDRTLDIAREMSKKNSNIRIVNFSRNFGKEIATTAGISYAKGEAIIMMDADGQHPPEYISDFISLWEKGFQIVIGVRRTNQKEGFIKRYGSRLFYKLFNATGDTALIPGATDFRLIDRSVQQEFIRFTERHRITRGLIDWMGFNKTTLDFHAKERIGGKASYNVNKLFGLAIHTFISLSMAPLYIISYVGGFITIASFMTGLFIFFEQIILGDPLGLAFTGTAMLSILILFLVGLILTAQGLISMYLSHVHVQTQNRPLFIVDKKSSVNIE
jgi:polyisoprenyl-phosphate glycosyltransferase